MSYQRMIRFAFLPLVALSLLAALVLFTTGQPTPAQAAVPKPDLRQMPGNMPMTGTVPMTSTMPQMMNMMGQMMQMMNQMHTMMGQNMEITGTMPMRQPGLGAQMSMMGHMMQMMGMMQEMGQPCLGMMTGAPLRGALPMTSTLPMTGALPMEDYTAPRMMQMMGHMMQMMGMMQMMETEMPMMRGALPVTGTMPMSRMRLGMMDIGPMQGMMRNMMLMMMAPCLQMMESTSTITSTMPMTGAMPMQRSMMPMMGMMQQMQQMMDQMHHMMGNAPLTTTTPLIATPASKPRVDLTQTAQAGDVTVKVRPLNLDDAAAATLDFEVRFDTHSIDLDMDLVKTATLRAGETELAPTAWESDSAPGHHVVGVLRFPAPGDASAEALTLTIGGLPEGGEAAFIWVLRE